MYASARHARHSPACSSQLRSCRHHFVDVLTLTARGPRIILARLEDSMALNANRTFRLNGLAVGVIVVTVVCFGAAPAFAQPGGLFQKPHVLFIQQDKVVTFDVTPPNAQQPLG